MSEYRVLFDVRGSRYNRANRLFPEARAEEASSLLAHVALVPAGRWLDVGAGGGFLAERATAAGARAKGVACDESAAFLAGASHYLARTVAEYVRLPFSDGAFSASACLAALHHAEDPGRIVSEMLRVTAPPGRAAIGDVAAGSRAAAFLNGFVDAHTEMGHAGRFYGPREFGGFFEAAGGTGIRAERVDLHWRFVGRSDARAFVRELFGLVAETPEAEIDEALKGLGLFESDGWRLPWPMVFASASR